MALTLDATPGGASSNTYVTLANAETIMEGVFYKSNWEAATNPNKNIALVEATRILDEQINWKGSRTTPAIQALEFPRVNCPMRPGDDGYIDYFDDETIPTWLENATSILADSILGSNRSAENDTRGFKELKVDVLEIVVDKSDRPGILPDAIWEMVKFYGNKAGTSTFLKRN